MSRLEYIGSIPIEYMSRQATDAGYRVTNGLTITSFIIAYDDDELIEDDRWLLTPGPIRKRFIQLHKTKTQELIEMAADLNYDIYPIHGIYDLIRLIMYREFKPRSNWQFRPYQDISLALEDVFSLTQQGINLLIKTAGLTLDRDIPIVDRIWQKVYFVTMVLYHWGYIIDEDADMIEINLDRFSELMWLDNDDLISLHQDLDPLADESNSRFELIREIIVLGA